MVTVPVCYTVGLIALGSSTLPFSVNRIINMAQILNFERTNIVHLSKDGKVCNACNKNLKENERYVTDSKFFFSSQREIQTCSSGH